MDLIFISFWSLHVWLDDWSIDSVVQLFGWLIDWLNDFFFDLIFFIFFELKYVQSKQFFRFSILLFFSFPICFDLNFSFLYSKNARVYQSYTYDYISNNWLKDFKNTRSIPFPLNSFGILILELCSMINLKNKDAE